MSLYAVGCRLSHLANSEVLRREKSLILLWRVGKRMSVLSGVSNVDLGSTPMLTPDDFVNRSILGSMTTHYFSDQKNHFLKYYVNFRIIYWFSYILISENLTAVTFCNMHSVRFITHFIVLFITLRPKTMQVCINKYIFKHCWQMFGTLYVTSTTIGLPQNNSKLSRF